MPENTLKLGIIGGALDSAIGRSHHIASQMDGRFRIVAGCFSLIPKVNEDTAALLDVPADRLYSDWHTFLKSEQGKLDAVLLLTPTPMHAEMAAEALAAGFPLISEKALAVSSAEAAAIRAARTASGLTLEEAALAVSIAKQTLGDLEAGKPSVGLGIALRVAKALGVSLFIAPAGEAGAIVQRIREARE